MKSDGLPYDAVVADMRRRALPSSLLGEDPSPEGLALCLSGDEQLSEPRWAASRKILMVDLRNSLFIRECLSRMTSNTNGDQHELRRTQSMVTPTTILQQPRPLSRRLTVGVLYLLTVYCPS